MLDDTPCVTRPFAVGRRQGAGWTASGVGVGVGSGVGVGVSSGVGVGVSSGVGVGVSSGVGVGTSSEGLADGLADGRADDGGQGSAATSPDADGDGIAKDGSTPLGSGVGIG